MTRRLHRMVLGGDAVAPEHHRRGIGSVLVRRAIRYLRGLGLSAIEIHAYADANPAVNLCRKIGSRIVNTVADETGRA